MIENSPRVAGSGVSVSDASGFGVPAESAVGVSAESVVGVLTGVETTEARLAVTAVAVGLLLAVLATSRPLQRRLSERVRPLTADVLTTVVLVGVSLLTLAVLVAVWEFTDELRDLWEAGYIDESTLARAAVSVVMLGTAHLLTRFVKRVLDDVMGSTANVSDHQREVSYRLTQVVVWALVSFLVLGIWIDDLGGLLVGAGFLGIVVGLAARQTLGSLISGFVLMFSRPFEVGDWVVVDDHDGVVTDISMVNTRIQTPDGEYVMIPNDRVGSTAVINRSKRGRLRVDIEVGIDYEADVERAAACARSAVEALEKSMSTPAPQVATSAFGESAVVLGVRFWVENPTSRRVTTARTEAIGAIKSAFDEDGITIPYPQRELSSRTERREFRFVDDSRGQSNEAPEGSERAESSEYTTEDP